LVNGGKTRRIEMRMIKVIVASVVLLAAILVVYAGDQPEQLPRDGVFIHISHGEEDPHRLLMALSMATKMAHDHDVLVYFDIDGIGAVLKDAEDISFEPFLSSKAALDTLRAKNVILMACPGCLNAAGKSHEDLAEGIQIADKATFFNFTEGRILSLDY